MHTQHPDALEVPGELAMIIVVTVIAIIVSHHGHYQWPAPSRRLSTLLTLMRAGGNVAEWRLP